jgi:hypothetical protein
MTITKIVEFNGFESLHGFDETLMWAVEELLDSFAIPAEFLGTLKFTMEYIPDESESVGESV